MCKYKIPGGTLPAASLPSSAQQAFLNHFPSVCFSVSSLKTVVFHCRHTKEILPFQWMSPPLVSERTCLVSFNAFEEQHHFVMTSPHGSQEDNIHCIFLSTSGYSKTCYKVGPSLGHRRGCSSCLAVEYSLS